MQQEIKLTEQDNTQRVSLEEKDSTQSLGFGNDSTFLKGEDGFSPTVEVSEVEGGFNVTVEDAKGESRFFIPSGNTVTDEQVQEAVEAYMVENPMEVADSATEGDMRPITSNAVRVEIGNIDILLKTI